MGCHGGGGGAGIARVALTDRVMPFCCRLASFRDLFSLPLCSLRFCVPVKLVCRSCVLRTISLLCGLFEAALLQGPIVSM